MPCHPSRAPCRGWDGRGTEDAEPEDVQKELRRRDGSHAASDHLVVDLRLQSRHELADDLRGRRRECLLEEVHQPLGMVVQLREQVGRDEGALADDVDVRVDDALDLAGQREVGLEDPDDAGDESAGGAREHRGREAVLGAEVVVQKRLVDACFLGDVLHASARGALADEDAVGGFEDPGFGFGAVVLLGHFN